MFQFSLVTPHEVHSRHTYYTNGIASAIEKGGSDHGAGEVMREIYNGGVYLYDVTGKDDDLLHGFVVLQEYTDCYSRKLVLHVDYAYLSQLSSGLMRLYQSFPRFAAAKGFDQIAFNSNRKGWDKYCERTGFNGATRIFYKDLHHG
jgi:hypothetical protein